MMHKKRRRNLLNSGGANLAVVLQGVLAWASRIVVGGWQRPRHWTTTQVSVVHGSKLCDKTHRSGKAADIACLERRLRWFKGARDTAGTVDKMNVLSRCKSSHENGRCDAFDGDYA